MVEDERPRDHAWLAREMQRPGGAQPVRAPGHDARLGPTSHPLPIVGELYQVNTMIFTLGSDRAPERPAVVVSIPPISAAHFPIQLVTRTSKPVAGVKHPMDPNLELDRDGVFADLASVEPVLWLPSNVRYLGVLSDPFLGEVLRRFGFE